MILATILMTFALLSDTGLPSAAGIAIGQTPQSQQSSQPEKLAEQPAATVPGRPAPPAVQPAPVPCTTGSQTTADHPAPCKTPSHKKHHVPRTVPDSGTGTSKTIVRHGSTSDPNVQLGTGVSPQQASQKSQTTAQLLASTNANLTSLGDRTLTSEQQETVNQVKRYMDQSKAAASDGDVQRAYNLALKAKLLSAELIKH